MNLEFRMDFGFLESKWSGVYYRKMKLPGTTTKHTAKLWTLAAIF
jgi:hypothetical protein